MDNNMQEFEDAIRLDTSHELELHLEPEWEGVVFQKLNGKYCHKPTQFAYWAWCKGREIEYLYYTSVVNCGQY